MILANATITYHRTDLCKSFFHLGFCERLCMLWIFQAKLPEALISMLNFFLNLA